MYVSFQPSSAGADNFKTHSAEKKESTSQQYTNHGSEIIAGRPEKNQEEYLNL